MLAIQPISLSRQNEKLAAVGILARVGRCQHARLTVFVNKILVGKGARAVNAHFPCAVKIDKIATLNHESLFAHPRVIIKRLWSVRVHTKEPWLTPTYTYLDDSMKNGILVACRLLILQEFTSAKLFFLKIVKNNLPASHIFSRH